MIKLIAAVAHNNVIGKHNDLPWYIPEDLAYFKEQTQHHVVVMGRKTYESIGKPLPNRLNIVVTSQSSLFEQTPHLLIAKSLEDAIVKAKELKPDKDIWIIGGAQLFAEALDKNVIEKMHITKVHHSFDGDIYFPEISERNWHLVSQHKKVTSKSIELSFNIYERVSMPLS